MYLSMSVEYFFCIYLAGPLPNIGPLISVCYFFFTPTLNLLVL